MSASGSVTAADVDIACHARDYERLRLWSETVRFADLFPDATPLHAAAMRDDADHVAALCGCGFAGLVDRFDDIGYAPIHYAVCDGRFRAVSALIAAGADVDARCDERNGHTPLDLAVMRNTPEVVHALLDAGADPSMPTVMGLTALHAVEERIHYRLMDLRRWCERTGEDFSLFENPSERTTVADEELEAWRRLLRRMSRSKS